MSFPGKRTLTVFQYLNYLPLCQKSEKPNEPFPRKLWHTKNQFISLISLWDTASFKVLQLIEMSWKQSDWPRVFWAISQKPEFSQIWNLFKHKRTAVIETFIIDHSVHWGIPPLKNTIPLFFAKPPFKLENCPSPPL